ncbi:type II secretion system F family protein [Thermogutta sp.]|uniref:type II secretion system F family protein n=1 Tax=Thermogutta sp. TaxID=1962930 RepID=UPI003C7C7F7A
MPWHEWLYPVLTFTTVSGILLLIALRFLGKQLSGQNAQQDFDPADLLYVSPEKAARTRLDRWFYELLEAAGSTLDRTTASMTPAASAVLGAAVCLVLFDDFLLAMLGTLVGAVIPLMWWKFRAWRRVTAMRKELPSTLELFADAVRSGLSLERATVLAAEESKGPLQSEFRWCATQLELGHSPQRVMERMSYRIPLPEFRIFATAVLVHRRTGGDLANLASRLARSARERSEFRGHMKAVTAGSRLSVLGLTIGILIAVAVLGWTRPDYVQQFLTHPRGPTLLGIAGGLQLVGLFWVWRILQVKY